MEKVPETAEPSTDADERAPLGVRVIAGLLLVSGTCGVIDLVLDWCTGRGIELPVSVGILLIGWGLLRRREWARVWTVVLASFSLVGLVLGLVVVIVVDGTNLTVNPNFGIEGLIGKKTIAFAITAALFSTVVAVWKIAHSERVRDWFKQPDIEPFIEFIPKRWRFGLGTLFYLTFVVAFATMNVMVHPGIRVMRAEAWVAKQDLRDPVYFPNGAEPLPPLGSRSERMRGTMNGIQACNYGLGTIPLRDAEPQLDYLVFERTSATSWTSSVAEEVFDPDDKPRSVLEVPGYEPLHFPGDIQIAEVTDGKLSTSDLRITPLEFWSYWNHPNAEWSLDGLETYIKDLRRRVAEREAKNTSQP